MSCWAIPRSYLHTTTKHPFIWRFQLFSEEISYGLSSTFWLWFWPRTQIKSVLLGYMYTGIPPTWVSPKCIARLVTCVVTFNDKCHIHKTGFQNSARDLWPRYLFSVDFPWIDHGSLVFISDGFHLDEAWKSAQSNAISQFATSSFHSYCRFQCFTRPTRSMQIYLQKIGTDLHKSKHKEYFH